MKRLALLTVAFSLALAGCSGDPDPAASSPPPAVTSSALPEASGSAVPTASPTVSPTPAIQFTVDGAGPYQIGATLTALQAAGALDSVATNGELCPANTTAKGVGVWAEVRLSFRADGALYLVVNRSKTIPTPSGARLGMSLAAVESIYGSLGKELDGGGGVAYLVTTDNGRGILFDLDEKKKVMAMIAADAEYLKSSYLGGTDFC